MFTVSYSICYISQNNDYYPFGSLVPNRHSSSPVYRYGFQGQEKDDELKGEGNSWNYTFRMHDPRIGRFFAVDPLESQYAFYSPYQFGGNSVIRFVELEGAETRDPSIFTKTLNVLSGQFVVNRLNNYITENKIPEESVITLKNDTYVVIKVLDNSSIRYSIFRASKKEYDLWPRLLTDSENDDLELTQKEFNNTQILGNSVMPAPGVGGGASKASEGLRLLGSGGKAYKFGQIVGALKEVRIGIQAWRNEISIGKLIATSGSKDLLKKGLHLHFEKLGGLELGLKIEEGVLSLKWLNVGKMSDIKDAVKTFNKSMANPQFKATLNASVNSAIETLNDASKFLKGSDLENANKVMNE